MIKVECKVTNNVSASKVELYDSINRIPFSVFIGERDTFPESNFYDYYQDQVFVSFRFKKSNNSLYEINLITITHENTIVDQSILNLSNDQFFSCTLIENDELPGSTLPMKLLRRAGSLELLFNQSTEPVFKYFRIAPNVYLSVDENGFLTSVVLDGLSADDIYTILGF